MNPDAAHILVEEGPERIEELIAWGTQFDRDGSKLSFTREGAHSRDRILHAHGDSTGREIGRSLYLKANSLKNISIREFEFATSLIVEHGRVVGLNLLDQKGTLHHGSRRSCAACHWRAWSRFQRDHQSQRRYWRRRRDGLSCRALNSVTWSSSSFIRRRSM